MFEGVGENNNKGTKRKAGAIMASVFLNGSVIIGLIYVGQQVSEEIQDEIPVEVTFFDAAPPPPPPPPPPPGGKKKKKDKKKKDKPKEKKPKVEEVEPEIEEVEEPAEEPSEEPEVEEEEEEGEEGGQEGGVEGGVQGGVVGGVVGGVLGGQLGGFNAVHWSDVKIKRQIPPKFPQAAKRLNITEERCLVRFFIDEKGKPMEVKIEKCNKIFHDELTSAAMKWRFYPVKSESGQKAKAQFLLSVVFKLR